jgi:hypothetical protein
MKATGIMKRVYESIRMYPPLDERIVCGGCDERICDETMGEMHLCSSVPKTTFRVESKRAWADLQS